MPTHKVETGFSCGRHFLTVNGFVVAVEGDLCRDFELPGTHWNEKLLQTVAKDVKRGALRKEVKLSSVPDVDAEAVYLADRKERRDAHEQFVGASLQGTFFAVEASHHEKQQLWEEWSVEADDLVPRSKRPFIYWEQLTSGFTETLGRIGDRPIVLSGFFARLRAKPTDPGKLVLFWELCSQLADYAMAERWLSETLPKVPTTNAQNFCICAHAVTG